MKIQELISKLLELLQNKDYEKMIIILNENQSYKNTDNGKLIYRLLNDIVRIKQYKRNPKQTNRKSNNYKNAIENSNYSLALSLCKSIKNPYNAKEIKILITLLTDINKLMDETKEQELVINKEKDKREGKIQEIDNLLTLNEIDKAKELISIFLTENNQQEYIFLINKLIEISNLKDNKDYKNVIETLKQIALSTTIIEFKALIGKFKKSVNDGHIKESNIYLEIINYYQLIFPDEITRKEFNQFRTLLLQYNAIEVFLNQTKISLERQGICAVRLDNIQPQTKDIHIKISYSIPGITVIDVNGVLLFVRRDRTDELKKLLIQLIKIYDVDTIIRIFNEVGVILDNRDKYYLKQITHYVVENNILFKFTKALFSLNEREVQIIKLLAIEIYYMSENYTRGDELFVSTPFSKELDEELLLFRGYIKVNRDAYKNIRGFSKRLIRIRKQSNE